MHSIPEYSCKNGDIVPFADATVHILSPTVHYGTGVFEGIRGYWNDDDKQLYIFRLDDHLERLEQSQRLMRFERVIKKNIIKKNILDLIKKNDHRETIHIRPSVYLEGHGGIGSIGPVGYGITTISRPSSDLVTKGCTAQISSWLRTPENVMPMRVKAFANYNNSRYAQLQANTDGYDTAIILNADGTVSEGPGQCIFIIKDNVLITPDIGSNILESITRQTVLDLSLSLAIPYKERKILRSELYTADEVFFCGSGWEITPIISIDGYQFEIGDVTKKIQNLYFDSVYGKNDLYEYWRTSVY